VIDTFKRINRWLRFVRGTSYKFKESLCCLSIMNPELVMTKANSFGEKENIGGIDSVW